MTPFTQIHIPSRRRLRRAMLFLSLIGVVCAVAFVKVNAATQAEQLRAKGPVLLRLLDTHSAEPDYVAGDLVLCQPVPYENLKMGMMVISLPAHRNTVIGPHKLAFSANGTTYYFMLTNV